MRNLQIFRLSPCHLLAVIKFSFLCPPPITFIRRVKRDKNFFFVCTTVYTYLLFRPILAKSSSEKIANNHLTMGSYRINLSFINNNGVMGNLKLDRILISFFPSHTVNVMLFCILYCDEHTLKISTSYTYYAFFSRNKYKKLYV